MLVCVYHNKRHHISEDRNHDTYSRDNHKSPISNKCSLLAATSWAVTSLLSLNYLISTSLAIKVFGESLYYAVWQQCYFCPGKMDAIIGKKVLPED
jgi:hypothetical protein